MLFTPKELLLCLFPVFSKYQWYLTAYVLLFFCIPILKILLNSLSKKQIEVFLTIILLFTTIVPIGLRTDTFDMNYGYSAWWMGILFLVGGYVSKYKPFKQIKKGQWLLLYFGVTTITWGIGYIVELCTLELMGNAIYGDWLYNYSSVTVFLAAFSLFMFFEQLEIKSKASNRLLRTISGATFGVYLIHTTKGLWNFSDNILENHITGLPHYVLTLFSLTICVFSISVVIEVLREYLFKKLRVNCLISRITNSSVIQRINNLFNFR